MYRNSARCVVAVPHGSCDARRDVIHNERPEMVVMVLHGVHFDSYRRRSGFVVLAGTRESGRSGVED